jgi:hypothetical protein
MPGAQMSELMELIKLQSTNYDCEEFSRSLEVFREHPDGQFPAIDWKFTRSYKGKAKSYTIPSIVTGITSN